MLGFRRLVGLLGLVATTLAGCSAEDPSARPGANRATVTGVSDGDTIQLSGIGKVRLIGVDTPEVYGGEECFGQAASEFTKRVLTPGRAVRYRLGVESRDRYGRALAYVWLGDGRMFNRILVSAGFAQPLTIPPNDDFAALFVRAARRARRRGRGLWGRAGCAVGPGDTRGGEDPASDRDCGNFASRESAQRYFDAHGGSSANDVDQLDGEDHDGRVCESLP
jgi:micrococcal nuclease